MANGGVTSTTGPTTAGHPPYPWGSLASLCSSACGTPTQVPLVEPKWGGEWKGGPTRAQPHASFMRTPEDTHLPVGGVRRAILSYGVLYTAVQPHLELARTQLPSGAWDAAR